MFAMYFEPTLSLLSAVFAQTISKILSPQGTRGTIILFNSFSNLPSNRGTILIRNLPQVTRKEIAPNLSKQSLL